jgi:hypothetical protein
MSPRAGMDAMETTLPLVGIEPQSRCTNCTIPAFINPAMDENSLQYRVHTSSEAYIGRYRMGYWGEGGALPVSVSKSDGFGLKRVLRVTANKIILVYEN